VTTREGVNEELMPFVRVTVPLRARGLTLAALPLGVHELPACLRRQPVRRPFLNIDDVGERHSSSARRPCSRLWQHERTARPEGDGCRVIDTVAFEPRLAVAAPLVRRIAAPLFRHRARRLQTVLRAMRRRRTR
jgi:hypothetical protein